MDSLVDLWSSLTALALAITIPMVIAVVVLLVVRHFVCWYWKLNEIVKLLARQTEILELMDRRMAAIEWRYTGQSATSLAAPTPPAPSMAPPR